MSSLVDSTPTERIDALAALYARRLGELRAVVEAIEAETLAVRRRHNARLKAAFARALADQEQLRSLVRDNAGLFVKPRTWKLHGIKLGYKKAKDQLLVPDEARTCSLIRKHLLDQEEVLIKTSESVVKAAAEHLDDADKKRIGVTVVEGKDEIVIGSTESDVDKLIDRLMKEAAKAGDEDDSINGRPDGWNGDGM